MSLVFLSSVSHWPIVAESPGKFAAALREEDLKLRLSARCGAAEMKRINDLWNSLAFGHRGHPTV
jgi:hypothetical protein